jgi:hypothetical protein
VNINRTNYENFFLLYVDGELSANEMQAVDRFTAENVDLQTELEILLDTKLIPDNVVLFTDKNSLYRSASNTINEFNFEEQFLLFVDNELSDEGKEQTLQFIAKYPEHQQSLELLKQTRLPEETIVFANKELLFRKEEDRRPILIGWRRIAIAAAMIGLISLVWNLLPNNSKEQGFAKNKAVQPATKKENSINNTGININATNNPPANQNIAVANQLPSKIKTGFTNKPLANPVIENTVTVNENLAINQAPKRIPEPEFITEKILSNNSDANMNTGFKINTDHSNQITNTANRVDNDIEQPVFHQAVYKELDTDDEAKSLYVAGLELNKDKLRGIFRKASSIFQRKIKGEDDKYESSVTTRALK